MIDIFTATQAQLFRHFSEFAGARFSSRRWVYLPPADGTPCRVLFCAHLDTVSRFPPDRQDIDMSGGVWSLRPGSRADCLGADDRAGVFALLTLRNLGFFMQGRGFAVFCDEELGALGSHSFDVMLPALELVIGLDRRGSCDLAEYGHFSPELRVLARKFGFISTFGSMSDCSVLSYTYDVPCGNFSVGYGNEHTRDEYLVVSSLYHTIRSIRQMRWDLPFTGELSRRVYSRLLRDRADVCPECGNFMTKGVCTVCNFVGGAYV